MKTRTVKKSGKQYENYYVLPTLVKSSPKRKTWNSRSTYSTWYFRNQYWTTETIEIDEIDDKLDENVVRFVIGLLRNQNMSVSKTEELKRFLEENKGLALVAKKAMQRQPHPYLSRILVSTLQNQLFVICNTSKSTDNMTSNN